MTNYTFVTLCILSGCTASPAPVAAGRTGKAATAADAKPDVPTFTVVAHGGGHDLDVEGTIPSPAGTHVSVDSEAMAGVHDAQVLQAGGWENLPLTGDAAAFVLPTCTPGPCRVRYHFAMDDVGQSAHDAEVVSGKSDAYISPSTSWLLLPDSGSDAVPAHRFHVQMDKGRFASGAAPAPGSVSSVGSESSGDFFQGATDLAAPFSVFGAWRIERFALGNAHVDVAIGPGKLALSDATLADLIRRTVTRIADYDGVFPAPHTLVILLPSRHGDGNGLTLGGAGASVLLHVPPDADEAQIEREWVPTHELLHVAFPSVGYPHRWIEEGLSTYLEPVVRARAGTLDEKKFWTDLVEGLPQGEPIAGANGLIHTSDWASTYWGGALFWFQVDLGIRRRTGGKRSLRDALHAIAAEGGNTGEHWSIDRVIEVGDRGAGVPVLRETYAAMALERGPVDLAAIWTSLGISATSSGVTFDEHAPEAVFRHQIALGGP